MLSQGWCSDRITSWIPGRFSKYIFLYLLILLQNVNVKNVKDFARISYPFSLQQHLISLPLVYTLNIPKAGINPSVRFSRNSSRCSIKFGSIIYAIKYELSVICKSDYCIISCNNVKNNSDKTIVGLAAIDVNTDYMTKYVVP